MKIELFFDQMIRHAYQGSIEAAEEIATELIEVYKTMSKREWVGLTDEEWDYIWDEVDTDMWSQTSREDAERMIEAKLKEKNTINTYAPEDSMHINTLGGT